MRQPILPSKLNTLATVLLLALSLTAKADPVPTDQNLDFNDAGEAKVNGALFQEGMAEKPADVYADVVKVIQAPDGTSVLYLRPVEAHKTGADGDVEKFSVASAEPRPFVPEGDWKMFDAEGQVTTDPHFALRVIMPYPSDINAAMFDVKWNECQGALTGNYSGLPCNKNRGLSDDYMAFLKQHYLPCVNAALAKAGLPAAKAVHITHDGTVADERHSRGSLHAVGRAIDVMKVITTGADGRTNTFDFTKTNTNRRLSHSCAPAGTANCKFFEGFRACWHQLHVARHCPARRSGPIGTIGWEDRDHIAHHLHTSYPFCPNNKGYFITESSQENP
jgi:hypothetical protein